VAATWLRHARRRVRALSADRLAVVLECVECGARWPPADEARWQLREVDLDEFAWYCRRCAARVRLERLRVTLRLGA
jgi:RNase P subunit RPR2